VLGGRRHRDDLPFPLEKLRCCSVLRDDVGHSLSVDHRDWKICSDSVGRMSVRAVEALCAAEMFAHAYPVPTRMDLRIRAS
jgi:hypothetical protein